MTDVLVVAWWDVRPPEASHARGWTDPLWRALVDSLGTDEAGETQRRGYAAVRSDLALRRLVLDEANAYYGVWPQWNARWGVLHGTRDPGISVFRPDLRLSTDGPSVPALRMIERIVSDLRPRRVVSIGLGGAGQLHHRGGDVVIAGHAGFDLTGDDLAGFEDNGTVHGNLLSLPPDLFTDLELPQLQDPALLPSSPGFPEPAGGWPRPAPHQPAVHVEADRALLTRPATQDPSFRPLSVRDIERDPGTAAVERDAATVAKVCQAAGVPMTAVVGITVPALTSFDVDGRRVDHQGSLRAAWLQEFSAHYSDAAARAAAEAARRICAHAVT